MTITYKEAVEKINSLQSNAALLSQLRKAGPRMNERSLPEMREYFKRIGYECKEFNRLNVIHITGTKGKGSTSAITQSILEHFPTGDKPLRTGLFTSPHLVAVRERIRINGRPLSEEKFAKYSEEVWQRLEDTKSEALAAMEERAAKDGMDLKAAIKNNREHPDKPVYFRYLTLVALHTFIRENVDVAILEVGIGGEYDSTNVVERPVVCGITALGLDHVNVLGNTIDQIAWHKAGIIKHGVPAVTFDQVPEALAVIEQRAKEKEAPLQVIQACDIDRLKDIEIGLAGIHQKYNALVAIELCRIWLEKCRGLKLSTNPVPAEFTEGLRRVQWPGRGQKVGISETKYAGKVSQELSWYLDGAHTVESLDVCSDWFSTQVDQAASRVLIFNCTHGRDGAKLLRSLSKLSFDHVIFSSNVTYRQGYASEAISDNADKTTSAEEIQETQIKLAEGWKELHPSFDSDKIHVTPSLEDAVEWVVSHANQADKRVQVLSTGSMLMVGNIMAVLDMPCK
ncbi:Folylpolyglutamate synthetase [Apophysomyces ossiformis]|uniref:Folylpolyglutamate synthase n=1 Tax=Apophysomyces ossiformis TaxID=679940 RepID=A0A8H7BJ62_9FUNG|nr:Folylpolyglutamate synthetase [Apophysomyces ossiformis]